ncbi:MAG TPA: immunoglobulin domain-containing protein, partial [Clostridia bacterium]|nr:immunoglobulin domain-containing protein [Clostridia bacterium]
KSYIGQSNWDIDAHFKGSMYGINIWNVTRTQEQIQKDMNCSFVGNEQNLVAYYPLTEGAGTATADLTTNHNNGSFMNGLAWDKIGGFDYSVVLKQNSSANIDKLKINDTDAGMNKIELSLSASHGTLNFTNTDSLDFIKGKNGDSSITINSTVESINAALKTLAYRPVDGFFGSDSVVIHVSDLGYTGAGGPLTDDKNININVVALPPQITEQPASQSVEEGHSVTFSVTASGTGLSYQWKKDGVNINGATSAALTITNVQKSDEGSYTVLVSNSAGSVETTGAALTVTKATPVAEKPVIATSPQSQSVEAGHSITFSVTATGEGLSYQWKKDGVNINGATSAALTITNIQKSDEGSYTVLVSNSAGSVETTGATLTVTIVTPVEDGPTITVQPSSQSITEGQSVTFSVTAVGTNIGYQWKKNEVDILGANFNTYTILSATTSDSGNYSVAITNTKGSITSQKAVLTVNPVVPSSGGVVTVPTSAESKTEILINGKSENAATSTTTTQDGQTVTQITLDDKKIEEKLKSEKDNSVIALSAPINSDAIIGELNGKTVRNMEDKKAVIEVTIGNVTYTLPAEQINIDNAAKLLNNKPLEKIKVKLEILDSTENRVKFIEDKAKKDRLDIIAPPVEFRITCTDGEKTIEIDRFNNYVERTICIPENIDPEKITTGVTIDEDGTIRHIPTKVFIKNNRYYAKINSLTNSEYSIVWHPLNFKDVSQHWSKDADDDMGSRLIMKGMEDGNFNPDGNMTRAEFTSIIIKALGLKPGTGISHFEDCYNAILSAYIGTAAQYGIIF